MNETPPEVLVSIRIAAKPETIYRYFTDPDRFQRWMTGFPCTLTDAGQYEILYPQGHMAKGEFTERVPNERAVFTWGYTKEEFGMPPGSSQVEIRLIPDGPTSTLVQLTHTGLPNDEMRKGHEQGWNYYQSVLASCASKDEHEDRTPDIAERFLACWNETDSDKRLTSLQSLMAEGAPFRGSMGHTTGPEGLNKHIGAVQMHRKELRLQLDGVAIRGQEMIVVPWKIEGKNGEVSSRGYDVLRLNLEGKIIEVTGMVAE